MRQISGSFAERRKPRRTALIAYEHHRWFDQLAADIASDYQQLHAVARKDAQRAGHGGESTWLRLLNNWLPPTYGVGQRKYILPERDGEEPFETDIVVFNPAYPERLREREEILAGGVAAAFSVKLTLDRRELRRGQVGRSGVARPLGRS
jgi:hypothetical protein